MKLNMILASIFGGKKATTEATENMNTTNVVSINPSEDLAEALAKVDATNKKATEELEAVVLANVNNTDTDTEKKEIMTATEVLEAMTLEKVLETLRDQYVEKWETMKAKATTSAKIKKLLEKATTKALEAEKEALEAATSLTATEKKKATTAFVSSWWNEKKETLATMYTETLAKEAEALAKKEELKKKATEVLEAVASGETTMEAATATMTTEELEAMGEVATEKKKAEKEKAKKATDNMTGAMALEKLAILSVAHRHHDEGTATDEEKVKLAVNDVETSKEATMKELEAEEKETEKETKKAEAEAVAKEYTTSKAIKHMKEEVETWQTLLNKRGVNIDVASMTPHTIFGNIHPYLCVPTGRGIKANLGKGTKALEKWSVENLYTFIWKNDRLNKKALATEVLEAHMKKVEKAEEAMKVVLDAKELLEKAKADKEEKEKVTSTASVEELEASIKNVETMEAVVKELETEAKETTSTMEADTMTMEAVAKKAMTLAKSERTRQVKKARKEGKEELATTLEKEATLLGIFAQKYANLRGVTLNEAMKELEGVMNTATMTETKAVVMAEAHTTEETTEELAKAM